MSAYPTRRRLLLLLAASALAFTGQVQAEPITDDFPGGSVNASIWTSRITAGSGIITVSDGTLTLGPGIPNASHRAKLISNTAGLDPFTEALTVTFDGLTLAGTATPGQPDHGNAFYAAIGRSKADTGTLDPGVTAQYSSVGGDYAGALGLLVRRSDTAVVLSILDRGDNNHTTTSHTLDAVPTRIVWQVDATGGSSTWSVTVTGATFTESSTTVVNGTFHRFTRSELEVAGEESVSHVSRLAIGAINMSAVVTPTVVTLDAVSAIGPVAPPPPDPPEELPWTVGVNLASAAFGGVYPGVLGTHYGWPQADDLDYHKARGMELIRLPFRWERIQQTLMGPLDPGELGRLDAFLDLAEERGMLVIPDMHNFGRYTIDGVQHIIGSPQVPRAAFFDVWDRLAAHLKDRQCIWAWGIMNEPYAMGTNTWKDTAQVGVNAVRLHDQRLPILIAGDGYSGAHSWLTYSADLIEIVDPANNLIFEAHQYFDHDHSGRYVGTYDEENAYPDAGVDRLAPFVNWCQQHGVRGFIGEYGVPDDDPRWLVVLDRMIAYMRDHNLSGTYWAAGPRWGSYKLRSNIRPLHDESPQMQAMLPHVTGPGTRYWPPFTWYHDSVTTGATSSYSFHYKSDDALLEADFADPGSSHSGSYNGAAGIRLAYTIPPGGWAGGGMNIEGGVNLSGNIAAEQVLSFYAKGTPGSSVRVFFTTDLGLNSVKVDTAGYVTLNDTWQRVRIPLSAFLNADFDGTQRARRLAMEGLPIDASSHVVQLDAFVIERPETTPPTVTVSLPDGVTEFPAESPIVVSAAASDTNGIDYVEFLVEGRRHGIATHAPYLATLSLSELGEHRVVAIAHDHYGNPARSSSVTLTIVEPSGSTFTAWQAAHFTELELDTPALEATVWGATADPDGDGRANLLEYALATDPRVSDSEVVALEIVTVGDSRVARYRRGKDLDPAVALTLQTATDLAPDSWSPLTEGETLHADFADHEIRDVPLPADAPRRFVRLQITQSLP